MRIVFRFIKSYRLSVVVAIALMLVELFVELSHPLLMAHIIDRGILPGRLGEVWLWGGLMIGLSLFGYLCGIINTYYAAHVSQGFAADMRSAMFERLQASSFGLFSRFSASTLMTRLSSDINQLQHAVFLSLRVFLRSPLLIVGSLVMALIVNVRLAVVLLIVTPLLFAALVILLSRGFRLFQKVQVRLDRTNHVLRETLLGMRLIRVFAGSDREKERFHEANIDQKERTIAALRLTEMTIPSLLMVMNISVLIMIWTGTMQVASMRIDVGEAVAVLNYAARITSAFSSVTMMLTSLSRARTAVHRAAEVLELQAERMEESPEKQAAQKQSEGKLVFHHVSFRFPDTDRYVLKDISFQIRTGEATALMGAAGSGKTSLLQLIPQLYETTHGTILIDGKPISSWDLRLLRKQIGYVPQEPALFSGTLRDNLLWGNEKATMQEIIVAAQRAQIHDTIMRLPKQYDTVLEQNAANLSGGQKQRLAIARALLCEPKLLLLDDCTSALDTRTEARLLAALRQYSCTIVMITQKINTAKQVDAILLLEDGKLSAQGRHDQLLQSSALYQRIIQSQKQEGEWYHA